MPHNIEARSRFQRWLLGDDEPQADAAADGGARPSAGPGPFDHDDVDPVSIESRLLQVLRERPTVTAGRLFFLDLDALKREFAAEWSRFAEVIQSTSKSVLRRNLAPKDVYCRYGDKGFLVVFANKSEAAATVICQRIAEDLRAALAGKTGNSRVAVRTVVGQADSRLLMEEIAPLGAATRVPVEAPESRQIPSAPQSDEPGSSPMPRAAAGPCAAKRRAEPVQAAQRRPPMPLPDIAADEEPGWKPMELQRSEPEPVPALPPEEIEEPEPMPDAYMFQPVWDTRNKLLSTYQCLRPDEVVSEPTFFGPAANPVDIDGDAIATADVYKLLNAAEMLDELSRNYFQLFVCVTIHADTMSSPRHRRQYLHVLRRVPEKLRKFLILHLCGLPEGAPSTRIVEWVTAILPYCGAILAETGLTSMAELSRFAGIGIHAVGADLRTMPPSESHLFADLARFSAEAERLKLWTFLVGVERSSQLIAATAAGVRYIGGPRIGSPSEVPMHIRRSRLQGFYQATPRERHSAT